MRAPRARRAGATGADDAIFLVRPNAGLPFAPVAETASGGELSRIALAIAAVAGGDTLVFDEIDAGIGGETAHAVGKLLQRLAERAQVVTITHLPQIAALADRHFRVEKTPGDPTHTRIEQLDETERKAELERMLGGEEFLAYRGCPDVTPRPRAYPSRLPATSRADDEPPRLRRRELGVAKSSHRLLST